jgi:hypothetical protein
VHSVRSGLDVLLQWEHVDKRLGLALARDVGRPVENIDARNVDTTPINHGYVMDELVVLKDLKMLLFDDLRADDRVNKTLQLFPDQPGTPAPDRRWRFLPAYWAVVRNAYGVASVLAP